MATGKIIKTTFVPMMEGLHVPHAPTLVQCLAPYTGRTWQWHATHALAGRLIPATARYDKIIIPNRRRPGPTRSRTLTDRRPPIHGSQNHCWFGAKEPINSSELTTL
jgi:hypothetical protein